MVLAGTGWSGAAASAAQAPFGPEPAHAKGVLSVKLAGRRGPYNGDDIVGIEFGGLLGLVILVLDIYAIIRTVQSGASTAAKLIWVVVILVLPVLGLLAWLIAGPNSPRT